MKTLFRFLLVLSFVLISASVFAEGLRDRLEGLVFDVEEWTTPTDAWLLDQSKPNKWMLWSKEKNAIEVRSNGRSLRSPVVLEDRKNPEEGAPALHTKITGIPNGVYRVYCNNTIRPLAFSFDAGKTWIRGNLHGEEFFGFFEIKNGTFELWVDDLFVTDPGRNKGGAYYDYIRFVPDTIPALSHLQHFTLPDGNTQISWSTSLPAIAATVKYRDADGTLQEVVEDEDNLRNHAVVLRNLKKGAPYTAEVMIPTNRANWGVTEKIEFIAGSHTIPGPTKQIKVPLRLEEPSEFPRSEWPVTSGLPFAKGILADVKDVRICAPDGQPVPAQFEVFSKWPDGSIKWLLCHFRASTQAKVPVYYQLETGKDIAFSTAQPQVQSEFHEKFIKAVSSRITLADGTALEYKASPFDVESSGPVQTTLKGEGSYYDKEGEPRFRWRARISFFGTSHVRIRWTIGNDQLEEQTTSIRSAVVTVAGPQGRTALLSDGKQVELPLSVVQLEDKKAVQQTGADRCEMESFNGFVQTGTHACYMPDFRETWPKGISANEESVTFSILPELGPDYFPQEAKKSDGYLIKYYWLKDGNYLFKRGMEIHQDCWLLSETSKPGSKDKPNKYARWLASPLFAVADPQYYCSSGTFPPVYPAQKGCFDAYENAFETSFAELEQGREKRGEFGWMNFGDWFGERTWNWGDNEYDLSYACALQFIRTGKIEYLKRGIQSAVHYSSIDFKAYPWTPKEKELMYRHCAGHVNGFFEESDPRVAPLLKDHEWKAESDRGGGHTYLPGNYYIASLIGDKRMFEVAILASWNQAKRYTPKFNFGIERAAGWCMNNAVYSYLFTGNPYYLNAADIYFEKILEKQNKETGCFDMPQNGRECDCPDKKDHRGGKAFAVGILLHSLIRYNEVRDSQQARDVLVRSADWLLDESWNEEAKGFRYKTGCPKFANKGWYTNLVTEGIGFAGHITGNPRYIDFLKRTLGPEIKKTSGSGRSSGKTFSMMYRQLPHTFYYMQTRGVNNPD